jgi:DNA-directed RNA polymerase subunit beta
MKLSTEERIRFGGRPDTVEIPDLIEIQKKSYEDFLQPHKHQAERLNQGLEAVFTEVFPIASYDGSCILEYVNYSLGVPKYDDVECQRRGLTYSVSLRVTFRLIQNDMVREESVYMGTIPIMTKRGTFIVNGAERVVVSQLHRSPGICFERKSEAKGEGLYSFRVIPYRGSWLEAEFDSNDLVYVYVDRRRRRRKVLATAFMKALGYTNNAEILELFFEPQKVTLTPRSAQKLVGKFLAKDAAGEENRIVYARCGEEITKSLLERLSAAGVKEVYIAEGAAAEHPIVKMVGRDETETYEDALKDIYRKLRPGDPATISNARAMIKRMFFDPKRYNLGKVGRHKINQKLGINGGENDGKGESLTLTKRDFVEAVKYLINLQMKGEGSVDDIDHLGNRRIRSVGELLENQCRIGLARMEKIIKERMNLFDLSSDTITPHKLINPKSLSGVIRDFFGRSQLSQFMDQTNPVAELTHKRRLSALGPGGLSRERAGFEVRDVHSSHYGRICPIETPEGPNIGLIASLSTYAKINDLGFIVTPYFKVVKGRVTDQIEYLTADEEEKHVIAQANVKLDKRGKFTEKKVFACARGDYADVDPNEVDYIDVSPRQLVSVVSGLIPFLEHNDANRALMGSNMQRQAVPILTTEAPLVATGLERKAAIDSGAMVIAEEDGTVADVDAEKIEVSPANKRRDPKVYVLKKFMRSNAGTCIHQKPLVRAGSRVKKGDVLADGPGTCGGELSLGRNVLVAFMPWGGYNFEDAILVSERLVKDDLFTSIHIEEFEMGARDTKLGCEEITRDIPNVGEEALRNLAEDGVIRVGAEVRPGDILVGKITPKSETELTPEERLLRAIFGEKAADVRDSSLVVPAGTEGIVMDTKMFSRKDKVYATEEEKAEEKERIDELTAEYNEKLDKLNRDFNEKLSALLLGEKLDVEIIDSQTGEVVIAPGKKITKRNIELLQSGRLENYLMPDNEITAMVKDIFMEHRQLLEELQMRHNREIERLKRGDELDPGVIKQVKVYVASQRKLQVGDKIAGRHGNKGVIAKIVAEEDMPFLPDGTPADMVLNPLGVPSRMNLGQVLETHLGWAAKTLGVKIATPVFDGINEKEIKGLLKKAGLPPDGKTVLYDGKTGEPFDQEVVVGYIYMMKLSHLVADKIHARAIGPYSLVTQQPLGGKAQMGGQRFGEMEVWALEAYGAAYALQELLTVKSDDVAGRTKIYESIVKGEQSLEAGTPESFNVLIKEMQSLCLDVRAEKM